MKFNIKFVKRVLVMLLMALLMKCVHQLFFQQSLSYIFREESQKNRYFAEFIKLNATTVLTVAPPRNLKAQQPVKHIGFLKVHKAASTTMQAIFLRFGWRRNLTFVLPREHNAFGYPNIISTNESVTSNNVLPPPFGKTFDILCHHVVYDKESWESILPADSVVIGTVRDPFSHFKSVLSYFNPGSIAKIVSKDPIDTFLQNPMKYENENVRSSIINNRIAFEYGVHPNVILKKQDKEFHSYLNNVLNKVFSVVIVAEHFDMSLIILRRKLNWSLEDILYVVKNVRNNKTMPDRYKVKDSLLPLFKDFAKFDYLLYNNFKDRLRKQIQAEGPYFWNELSHYVAVREYVQTFCTSAPASIQSITVAKSHWNDIFEISRKECEILMMDEINFTQMIRRRQYGNASWTLDKKNGQKP